MTYKQVSSDDGVLSEDVIENMEIILKSLTPYTRYSVTVQAFTGAGGGNISVVEVMTDEAGMSPQFNHKSTVTGDYELEKKNAKEQDHKIFFVLLRFLV